MNLDPPRDVGCPERGAAPGAACREQVGGHFTRGLLACHDARHEAARGRLRVVSATDTERRP